MVSVSFYTFAKKRNSTAVPSTAPLLVLSCALKEECSIINPVISVSTANPTAYNYAAISDFSRYYYISDWTYSGGLWWATLTVDVLASYKTHILNTTLYVARSASRYDGDVPDGMFPAKCKSTGWRSEWPTLQGTPWARAFGDGFYVVGIINNDGDSVGAVSYYAFTPAQFAALKTYLLGNTTWTDITSTNPDLGENLYKSLFNPFQYISTVNWFPLSYNASWGTAITGIKFGWWYLDTISCYRLNTYLYSFAQNLYAGEHPQAAQRGAYLNTSPFSTYRLMAPPFGEFTLDGSLIVNGTYVQYDTVKAVNVSCAIQVDFVSGQGDLWVSVNIGGGEWATLIHSQAPVCVPIQIAQINNNGWGEVRNTVETVGGMLSSAFSGNVGGVISNLATGVMNGLEAHVPHAQERGNNGSIGIYALDFALENIHAIMADDALVEKGRPLCRNVLLSTLSGYVQTVGADVAIPGSDTEMEELNTFLDGGAYLE